MASRIAVVPGDGIGTEVVAEGVRVLSALAPDLELVPFDLGADRYLRDGTTLDDNTLASWRKDFACIYLGALGDPRVPSNVHAKDILLGSRFKLDLYINLRPIKLLDERYCPLKGKGLATWTWSCSARTRRGSTRASAASSSATRTTRSRSEQEINTRKGVERIIRAAFAYAKEHGLTRVCMSDKANAMRHGHDLWQRVFKLVAGEHPTSRAATSTSTCSTMEMVRAPEQFQVIVTNNLFGDIVTDSRCPAARAESGSRRAATSTRVGVSLFEPVHGSAPNIAGQGIANPLASILTVGMMLRFLGRPALDERIQKAVQGCLHAGEVTKELGGALTTKQAGDAVLRRL
jgi:3-isopropylmalate dehydrogenase